MPVVLYARFAAKNAVAPECEPRRNGRTASVPTRMNRALGCAAASQMVSRSMATYGKRLYASPKNDSTKMATAPANGWPSDTGNRI